MQNTPGKRLRAVFMRRGPLPFAQSFLTLLSDSRSDPSLTSTLSFTFLTSYLPILPQSLSQTTAFARNFLSHSYSRISTATSSLVKRLISRRPSPSDEQIPDQTGSATSGISSVDPHGWLKKGARPPEIAASTSSHQRLKAFASAFVEERVMLLRSLKKQLLTALGEVSTVLYSTVGWISVQYSTIQPIAVQDSAFQSMQASASGTASKCMDRTARSYGTARQQVILIMSYTLVDCCSCPLCGPCTRSDVGGFNRARPPPPSGPRRLQQPLFHWQGQVQAQP